MPSVLDSKSKEDRNKKLYNWIKNLGDLEENKNPTAIDSANVKMYPDLDWIENKTELGDELTGLLLDIKKAERDTISKYTDFGGHYIPTFTNEELYKDMPHSDAGYRLLALFRYWNIIQYYFPYRYLMDEDWQKILTDFIPQFIEAKDELEYKLALLKLVTKTQDSHSYISGGAVMQKYHGEKTAPFEITFVEEKAMVTDFYKPQNINCNICKGDIILAVNNITVDSLINRYKEYTPASNRSALLRNIANILLRTNDEKVLIEYQHDNEVFSDSILCPSISKMKISYKFHQDKPFYRLLENNIGYIYVGSTQKSEAVNIDNTKAMIIDLRGYPNSEAINIITEEKFLPDSTEYASYTKASIENPGLFTFEPPIKTGKPNKNYYKKKKIILVNELTQSWAETIEMIYSNTPQTIVVGSQSAGANGDVLSIPLPGDVRASMSGIGFYYPDRKPLQRVGIIPDIEVKPTIKGVREGRDEVLEKAIELINADK